MCHETNVLLKFQGCISIFDLVTEEKRRSGYLGDVALIGRDNSFSCRCKSEIICIITSDTKLMSNPISRVTSEHLT